MHKRLALNTMFVLVTETHPSSSLFLDCDADLEKCLCVCKSCVLYPSAYQHISKTIEVSRVHLFDIVTQYRAIFPDDDLVKPSYSSSALASRTTAVTGALFYSWVNDKVLQ